MEDQKNKFIFQEVQKIVPGWQNFDSQESVVERMTGITNQTYKVSHPKANIPIIYRKFGESTQNIFLDRQAETIIYKHISEEELGPKIFGYGDGIRLESFIESKVLKTEQMLSRGYLERVAYSLREFHSMKEPKLEKKSLFSRLFFSQNSVLLQKIQNKLSKDIFNEKQKQQIEILRKWASKEEISYLKVLTSELQKEKLVFSHNDLLANNVLIRNADQKVIFIDYEYSCFNYPIFDIANYVNETQYDYDAKEEPYFGLIPEWPEKKCLIDRFMKCYCLASSIQYEKYLQITKQEEIKLSQQQEKEYELLKKQLKIGRMLSNLMWGWWAIIVCKNPEIQFDYIEFAMKRYRDYTNSKNEIKF